MPFQNQRQPILVSCRSDPHVVLTSYYCARTIGRTRLSCSRGSPLRTRTRAPRGPPSRRPRTVRGRCCDAVQNVAVRVTPRGASPPEISFKAWWRRPPRLPHLRLLNVVVLRDEQPGYLMPVQWLCRHCYNIFGHRRLECDVTPVRV